MRALEHRPRREQASDRRWASSLTGPWARAALVLAVVVVADQLTKRAVERSIVPGEERKLLPGVQLVNTRNHGIAFGVLTDSQVVVTILIGTLLALPIYALVRRIVQGSLPDDPRRRRRRAYTTGGLSPLQRPSAGR